MQRLVECLNGIDGWNRATGQSRSSRGLESWRRMAQLESTGRGHSAQRWGVTEAMGDTKRPDKPRTEPLSARREPRSSRKPDDQPARKQSSAEDMPQDSARLSLPPSENRAPGRRSSLRPAPPSFRPSTRDASQLRPMMVVHAGDVDPNSPRWDIVADPPPSQISQVPLDSATRSEPFALAESLEPSAEAEGDQTATLPLEMPTALASPDVAAKPCSTSPSAPDPRSPNQATRRSTKPPSRKTATAKASTENTVATAETAVAATSIKSDAPAAPSQSNPVQASAQPSGEPLEVEDFKPARSPKLALGIAAVVLVGVVAAIGVGRSRSTKDSTEVTRARAEQTERRVLPSAPEGTRAGAEQTAAKVLPSTPGPSPGADESEHRLDAATAAAAASVSGSPSPTETAPSSAEPNPRTTRVMLDVRPADAKVSLRGHAYPGPPFKFDIAEGKSMAVEVHKPGFVTARVEITGKKTHLSVGLVRETTTKSRK
jgi:hypothetical protein